MPIYEYQCDECKNEFQELVLSRSAEKDVVCNKCGSANLVKLLSGSAVHSGGGAGGSSSPGGGFAGGGGGCGSGCGCHH